MRAMMGMDISLYTEAMETMSSLGRNIGFLLQAIAQSVGEDRK